MKKDRENICILMDEMAEVGMFLDPLTTALVMGYNAGRVQESTFYTKVRGQDLRPAYLRELQAAAADTLMQLQVLLAIHLLDFDETLSMGEERLRERIEDIAKTRGGLPRPADAAAEDDILHRQVPYYQPVDEAPRTVLGVHVQPPPAEPPPDDPPLE